MEINLKSRNIQADILETISDGRLWSIKQIADKVEVHYSTVYRHIQALSYRFKIITFSGGANVGGVRLILKKNIDIDYLSMEDLTLIINILSDIKNKSNGIKKLIFDLSKNLNNLKTEKKGV